MLSQDQSLLQCPQRLIQCKAANQTLHKHIGRSKHTIPMPLTKPPPEHFFSERQGTLIFWMRQAELAIRKAKAVRQTAFSESFAQARYINIQKLRKLKKEAHGALDQRTIQSFQGKCPQWQRMWGISCTVILSVHLAAVADQHVMTLKYISGMRRMPPSVGVR